MSHSHLYHKKRARKVTLQMGGFFYSVKYACTCGDWWMRRIESDKNIPAFWNWVILSDETVKMGQIPSHP